MNTLDKQDYFVFIDKWFRINPESIVSFDQEAEEDVVVELKVNEKTS